MAQEIVCRWRRALPCGWLLLAVLVLTACGRPADEQALRDSIESMRQAVVDRETDSLIEHVADDFAGPQGMDRQSLRRLLVVQFLRNQSVSATLGPIETRVDGTRAEADFRVLLAGFGEGLLPARADGYRLRTGWRVEGGQWKLEWAQWE